jgi:hypothetical protein
MKKSFRPVEGNTGNHAANLFSFAGQDGFYLAAFNFSGTNVSWDMDANRLGLKWGLPAGETELWTGATNNVTNTISVHIGSADAVLLKFQPMRR